MKKQNFKISLIAKILLTVMCFFVFGALFGVVAGAAGVGIANLGVAVAGQAVDPITVRENVSTLDMEDISEDICKVLPFQTPMDTILRQVRKAEKIDSQLKRYYSVSSKPLKGVLHGTPLGNGAGTSASTATNSYTYSSGDGLTEYYIRVIDQTIWRKHDTFLMFDVAVNATGYVSTTKDTTTDIMFYVVDKSGDALRIKPVNGIKGANTNASKYVMPDFASTVTLYRAGNALEDKAMKVSPWAMIPEPDEQLCQHYMTQMEEATFQQMTKKEVSFGMADFEDQNIFDLRANIEMSQLFGFKSTVYNEADNDKRYTTQGITRMITNTATYTKSAGITSTNYLDWMSKVFVGSNGSQEKYLFAGADLIKLLHTVETVQKQVDGKNPVAKWGLTFSQITSYFGTLNIIHHPLLSLSGLGYNGIILDMAYVRKHNFVPMRTHILDLKSSGEANVDARTIQEVSCATLTNPNCHLLIKGV